MRAMFFTVAIVGGASVLACKNNNVNQSSTTTNNFTSVGATGGFVDGPDGTRVDIPPGALTEVVQMGILATTPTAALRADLIQSGKPYEFLPHDQYFAIDATIRMPAPAGNYDVWRSEPDGAWELFAKTKSKDGFVRFRSSTFSFYVLTSGSGGCVRNEDCEGGQTCGAGGTCDVGGDAGPDTGGDGGGDAAGSCLAGTWDHDKNPATFCIPWTDCVAGQYVSAPGSSAADRICKPCAARTTSDTENATTCRPVPEEVGVGSQHGCARFADKTVRCWGGNTEGYLGDGKTANNPTPTPVPGLTGVTQFSVALVHTCARREDGSVWCWGNNTAGKLGDGTTTARNVPTLVAGLTSATQVSAGGQHTCATRSDGSVRCWGYNAAGGGVGDGTTVMERLTPATVRTSTGTLTGAARVAVGGNYSCALMTDTSVQCWGSIVGRPTVYEATPISGLSGVTDIEVGEGHACALSSDGTVKCWGGNSYGSVGNGSTMFVANPTTIPGLASVAGISGKQHTMCAHLTTGAVWCWGWNNSGQVGDGTKMDKTSPVLIPGLSGASDVAANAGATCAQLATGEVRCWGRNDWGQFGRGAPLPAESLTPIPGVIW